jgi:glycosyltransferase involved in cell wall biosynthesis
LGFVIGQLSVGGAEGQLRTVVRALDRRFSPIVYSLSGASGPVADELRAAGIVVRDVGSRGPGRVLRLGRLLRSDGIELVHAWLFIANAYAAAAHLVAARVPLITSARNCKVQGRWSRLANMAAFRRSRLIVVNSDEVRTYVRRQYRAPNSRLRVMHNGVDTERFRPAALPPSLAALRARPIVNVGRLVPQKNHALFLDAAASLVAAVPDVRFVIVGDGPLRGGLEEQARRLGIAQRVSFLGERHDVDVVLRSASLLWLTSRWEGMPNVVLEAMASGVPAICTDVGGTREIVRPGVDGFIIGGGDGEAFVRRAAELLGNAELWRRCSGAARERAQQFSVARMVETLSQLYEEALRESC